MKLACLPLALTLLLLCPSTILGQIWGLQGQQSTFGQSTQQRRLPRGQQIQNDCQINQLTAAEPTNRIESEAGVTEIWEPRQQQELKCAGVTVIRHHIENKGLALPHYANAPIITYVVNGRGLIGVTIPGCPETYESGSSSEQSFSREGREESIDRHQKVRRIRQGEIIALPAGVSKWIYNDGQERLTLVSLYDTNNFQNQLDENLKGFFLAGNPQGRGGGGERRHETRRHGQGGQEKLGKNIFSGFDDELLAEAFGVDRELINRLPGQRDNRGAIIRVERHLRVLGPEWDDREEQVQRQLRDQEGQQDWRERTHRGGRGGRQGRQEEEEEWRERTHNEGRQGRGGQGSREEEEYDQSRERRPYHPGGRGSQGREEEWRGEEDERRERQHHGRGQRQGEEERQSCPRREGQRGSRGCSNGVEETLCSLRLTEDIDNPENADVFNPHGGRLTSVNSHKLRILNFLQLSAEKVKLYKNAILAPHWRVNAHTICYFTRGEGRIQVVDHQGRLVFDDTVNEGQLLTIPQNFVVVKRAGREGLEWVSFLTNDDAIISPLAGRISAIRGMPDEVVMNSFSVSREDAHKLKYSRSEFTLFSPSNATESRRGMFAIM
ncbi:11S globulin seed storage protein Jug r 4-like [Silene latifolia]|uniref:11S globulin seed storage protein Jug r 4-like n=1 Tax=Silene latifolia TaxID=37657 RepID=UPI003D76FB97